MKSYKNYKCLGKLLSEDSASHPIYLLKGKNSTWFFKEIPAEDREVQVNTILSEVIIQEFLRLMIPHQPKTRAILSDPESGDPSGVLSKKIEGFKSFKTVNPLKLIYLLLTGKITELGAIAVMLLVSCEHDAKLAGNIGINELIQAVKLDGNEAALTTGLDREINKRYAISERDILNLPFPPDYAKNKNINWLDQGNQNNHYFLYSLFWFFLSYQERFWEDVYRTLFKLNILPDSFIDQLIKNHPHPEGSIPCEKMSEQIKKRVSLFREKSLQLSAFITYKNSPQINRQFDLFHQHLSSFKVSGRKKLADSCGEYQVEMQEQFNLLKKISTLPNQGKLTSSRIMILIGLLSVTLFVCSKIMGSLVDSKDSKFTFSR